MHGKKRRKREKRNKGYVTIKGKIYTDKKFEDLLNINGYSFTGAKVDKKTKSFNGSVAYSAGVVRGKVSLMFNARDMKKFVKGRILVAPETSPVFLPAMKKAKAIITDEGGIASHASITSREFKIPCIVGSKVGTKLLKNGQEIEMDTKSGEIKIL